MLYIDKLSKSYPEKNNAIQNVSFHIAPGEICGLIGANGAGKSTLIRSVIGAQSVNSGTIRINGKLLHEAPIECKKVMAYIPDKQELYPYLTGEQYLNFVCDIYRIDPSCSERAVQEYSELLQMTDSLLKPTSTYSKGMKQKLLIIAALVHTPKLLIMDEPFSGLDPFTVEHLKTLIRQESEKGTAVLFSSHMLEIAEKICSHVVMIRNGNIAADLMTDETTDLNSLFFEESYETDL